MPQLSSAQRVYRLVVAIGEVRAAKVLGVSRGTVARAAAGLPVRRGSQLLIETALAQTATESSADQALTPSHHNEDDSRCGVVMR